MGNKLAFKVLAAGLLLLLMLQCAAGRHVAEKSCIDEAKLATVTADVDEAVQIEGAFKDLGGDIENSHHEFDEEVVSLVMSVDEDLGAPRWGPFRRGPCVRRRRGFRRYTARLFGVRGGNWNATCLNTTATIGRHRNIRPARCTRNRRGEIIGVFHVRDRHCRRVSDLEEFEVEDALEHSLELTEDVISEIDSHKEMVVSFEEDEVAAPRWGPFRRGPCLRRRRGFRRYTALLFGVSGGNWSSTCLNTTATIGSHRNLHPVRCRRNSRGQITGVFDVRDRGCRRALSDLEELENEAFEVHEEDLQIENALEFEDSVDHDPEDEIDDEEGAAFLDQETALDDEPAEALA